MFFSGRHVMSTPNGRPPRPASAVDYAPKRVREQWDRGDINDGADGEFTDDPATGGDDVPAQASDEADERISSLVPKGAHEDADGDTSEADDGHEQDWEGDEAAHDPHAPRDQRTEDWLDELEYRAELRERRAKAAEMDREYEDQLERLASSLRTLRNEDEDEQETERPLTSDPRRESGLHADAAGRDLYIDGVRLPRFLQASYVPPHAREGKTGWRGILFACVIACAVGAPLSYYFYLVGNPFASHPRESLTKSDVQYSIASVADRLPKLEERVADAHAATTPPPAATIPAPAATTPPPAATPPAAAPLPAETATQSAPKPSPALQPAAPAEPSQSAQAPRRVPLTHVVRRPDQAQDSIAAQPPRASGVGATSPSARTVPFPSPEFAPSAPESSLAYAPALAPAANPAPAATPAPAPVQPAVKPAPPRAAADDTDEVQLLLKQGQDFVAAGDLATARVVLRRATQAGSAVAAYTLAQTYDPQVLAKMRARGVEPDPAEARRWYEMAQKLGSREAAQQLERLARDD